MTEGQGLTANELYSQNGSALICCLWLNFAAWSCDPIGKQQLLPVCRLQPPRHHNNTSIEHAQLIQGSGVDGRAAAGLHQLIMRCHGYSTQPLLLLQ